MRSWSLLDREGRVCVPLLRVTPEQARETIRASDRTKPARAPHYVALAGGDSR